MTTITLIETGPNTGIFASESQLLMSPDLPIADHPDDVEPVHSNITRGTVPDNLPEDRTHRTTIDGSVRVEYQPFAGTTVRREIPVCNRSPEERRLLLMRAHVFNDPYADTGFDHDGIVRTPFVGAGNGQFDYIDVNHNGEHNLGEPSEPFTDINLDGARNTVLGDRAAATAYVNAQVERANIAWAQACIKVRIDGVITFEDAPQTEGGVNIIEDGRFNYPADNDRVVATRPAGSVSSDVLEVYFVPPIFDPRWAGGITVGPSRVWGQPLISTRQTISSLSSGHFGSVKSLSHIGDPSMVLRPARPMRARRGGSAISIVSLLCHSSNFSHYTNAISRHEHGHIGMTVGRNDIRY